jgi:AraC-like DNA-binding protein
MMSSLPAAAAGTLCIFEPPYVQLVPCAPGLVAELRDVEQWRGRALVWQLADHDRQRDEYEQLRHKAPGLPLIVLLPPPADIQRVLPILPLVRRLLPRMILPFGVIDTPYRLRHILAAPPRNVPAALTDYLVQRGLLRDRRPIREFKRIVELAPHIKNINTLARRMYTSRRTLGRHFIASRFPVPSHCLHFARLLHVAMQLQSDDAAVFRIAARFGYPDGFTMSNQMKRLIGYRPSEVRELLGWEWVVEAWLKKEGL